MYAERMPGNNLAKVRFQLPWGAHPGEVVRKTADFFSPPWETVPFGVFWSRGSACCADRQHRETFFEPVKAAKQFTQQTAKYLDRTAMALRKLYHARNIVSESHKFLPETAAPLQRMHDAATADGDRLQVSFER